jgi:hypothetical protein
MEGAEVKGKHGSFRMTRKSLMITDKHYRTLEPDTINMERARGTMRYHMQQMKQPDKR